jgi:hypothetical protein
MILEKYQLESLTARLDGMTQDLGDLLGPSEIKLKTILTTGLGNYNREDGYKTGVATIGWETKNLLVDRGASLEIDRVDSMETLNTMIGDLLNDFTTQHVISELDAYRAAQYAQGAGTKVEGTLNKDTIIPAIDEANMALNNAGAPTAGRVLFINNNLYPAINASLVRQWGSENGVSRELASYNGVPIVFVPPSRFHSEITLNPGGASFGYANAGEQINFLLIASNAVWQAVKVQNVKYVSADQNQLKDAHKFDFRIFHDAGVSAQNKLGVYCHKVAPPAPPAP